MTLYVTLLLFSGRTFFILNLKARSVQVQLRTAAAFPETRILPLPAGIIYRQFCTILQRRKQPCTAKDWHP